MTNSHASKVGDLDPCSTRIDFSPEVRGAFRDLAAAVHFSDHVGGEMLSILQEWAGNAKPSVQDVLIAFPPIAQQVFEHIHATKDKKAKAAWEELGSELLERGFTMRKDRSRTK